MIHASPHKVTRRDLGPVTRNTKVIDHRATGELMRRARDQSALSLRDMATRLNLSAPYLADLERGRRNWTEARVQQWIDAIFPPKV